MMHQNTINGLKFDKNKELILSWDFASVYLWSAETGELVKNPMNHWNSNYVDSINQDFIQSFKYIKEPFFYKDDGRILSWGGNSIWSQI